MPPNNPNLPVDIPVQDLLAAASKKQRRQAERIVQDGKQSLYAALLPLVLKAAGGKPLAVYIREQIASRSAMAEQRRIEKEDEARSWKGWFDGAADPNPGQRGIGALLVSPTGERHEISKAIGHGTNNEAEYEALIALLEKAIEVGASPLRVHGDSQLVILQVSGEWSCGSPNLYGLMRRAQQMVARIKGCKLRWVPREENQHADALSVQALGGVRETPEEKRAWGTQTDIGKRLGVSAVAVGRMLDKAGLRKGKRPTSAAIDEGMARVVEGHFGSEVSWHKDRATKALRALLATDLEHAPT